jgi:hypothetical protein
MKNQYFADLNDYRKYGLLRTLSGGILKSFVCWMLTEDDGSTDGKFRHHLGKDSKWQRYDPDLLKLLLECRRDVGEAERLKFVPSCGYFADVLKDDELSRQHYFDKLWPKVAEADLVFFDPDNGFEVKSRKRGNKHSCKYLYWPEVTRAYELGCSPLVYQHFRRQNRDAFVSRIAQRLRQETNAKAIFSFRTSQVVFFLAPQIKHHAHFEQQAKKLARWEDEITMTSHVF